MSNNKIRIIFFYPIRILIFAIDKIDKIKIKKKQFHEETHMLQYLF